MKNIVLILVLALFSNTAAAQVGIGTTTPRSTLEINGNLSIKVVSINGGPATARTAIDDGTYINLTPTAGNADFELPDPTVIPGRVYILRNVTDTQTAFILTQGAGVLFFAGDSTTGTGVVNMTSSIGNGNDDKTLIFVSDGSNWTYGKLGF